MATLHVDLSFGLSVEKTRNLLGKYSRGCDVPTFVRYMPKFELQSKEERYFDTTESKTIVFLSDFFGSTPPFDVQIILEGNSITNYNDCNMLMLEASNVIGIKVTNKSQETMRCHILL